jgi:hypothetical protein
VTLTLGKYHALSQTTKLLLIAKLSEAEEVHVKEGQVEIRGRAFAPLRSFYDWDHFRERQYVFRADTWAGRYEQFDLASEMWPVIPPRLFDQLGPRYGETAFLNKRTKVLHHYGNSLSAVSMLDPLLVHQKLGIYDAKHRSFPEKKPSSFVYRFEEARNNFWFAELESDTGELGSKRVRPMITAFVSARELTDAESIELGRYRNEDPEYVSGVENGWSLLFTGDRDLNVVCLPGIVSRQQLIEALPEAFWLSHNKDESVFLS